MFDLLTIEDCVAKSNSAPSEPRCSDAAYAAAHPETCGTYLLIKPESVLLCSPGSVEFHVFEYANGVETEVTNGIVFSSNEPDIFSVGSNSGSGSGLAAGAATVTVARNGLTASASVTVLAGSCCDEIHGKTEILIDDSLSSSLEFNATYATRLDFAKAAAKQFAAGILSKDAIKVWSFASTSDEISTEWLSDSTAIGLEIDSIVQTQEKTSLLLMLQSAISDLVSASADEKIILVISDGEQTTTSDVQPVLDAAAAFKADGGIIIAVGLRAAGAGYDLLSRIATGGFFLNAYSTNPDDILARISYLKGALCLGRCKSESGQTNVPELNYSSFLNWEVVQGMVNLVGNGFLDVWPGNGLYVDLAGGLTVQAASAAKIQTIDSFPIVSGNTYQISFKVAGNNRTSATSTQTAVKVVIRNAAAALTDNDIYSHLVTPNWNDGFQIYSFIFSAPFDANVKISFEQLVSSLFVQQGAEWHGYLLDNVEFSEVSTLTTLFSDDFDGENPSYAPADPCAEGADSGDLIPAMTSATTPSGIASASSQVPGDAFSAWQSMCGLTDYFHQWQSAIYPSNTAQWLQYQFQSPQIVTAYRLLILQGSRQMGPTSWTFEGSQNGTDWTVLDSHSNYVSAYQDVDTAPPTEFQIINSTPFTFYRLRVTDVEDHGNVAVSEFQMSHPTTGHGYGCYDDCPDVTVDTQIQDPSPLPDIEGGGSSGGQSYVSTKQACAACAVGSVNVLPGTSTPADATACASSTKSSNVSQGDADAKAVAAATTAAKALLNCVPVFTSTKTVHATCPAYSVGNSVDKTASATSYISQSDADAQAIAAATALANAELDCTLSNFGSKITINDNASATPYPSVQYIHAGDIFFEGGITKSFPETISRVKVFIKVLTHSSPEDVQILLRGPDGTCVMLMQNCGGQNAVNESFQIDDIATDSIPQNSLILYQVYKPTQYGIQPAFPLPAPQGVYGTQLSDFAGKSPIGPWSLWVIDNSPLDEGSITAWSVAIY